MGKVIKIAGRAKVAHLDGRTIERQDSIFVKSEGGWFPTVETYSHFVYKQDWKFGSTLMCTCGGPAGLFQYDAYGRFYSVNKGKMVCCVNFIQNGLHSDGSSE